jgi:hypothetical protein
MKITVKNPEHIPSDWKILNVRKKTTVKIRSCNGVEKFKVSWQDAELVSDPEVDLIVIQPNDKEYPCKSDIFWDTYELKKPCFHSDQSKFEYIKKATTQIVEIPEGYEVEIETLEGVLPVVTYPDYIAIGVKGELYANTKEFVDNNLEIL